MDPAWRIELFGGLYARQGDRVITRFRTQKTGALLGYLAYYRDRPHPREALIALLWPNAEPHKGRKSLSMALTSLRRQLEPPGVPRGTIIQAVPSKSSGVSLNRDAVTIDAADFEAALEDAGRTASAPERAQYLAKAVELYRGELLHGYYEEWIFPEQRRLTELFSQALGQLIRHLEQAGDLSRALDYARLKVSEDPLQEGSHRDLMRLLAASGQPFLALKQYRELERVLKQELGITPCAASLMLAREIEQASSSSPPAISPSSDAPPPAPGPMPAGTVTFLLTEIEGSGALRLEARAALAGQQALLHREFRRYGGYEAGEAEGSFTVAFVHPGNALACAIAGQRALAEHIWEDAGATGRVPLQVRMALHTGDVGTGDRYGDSALRLARQVLVAGYGGQILCTEEAAALLRRHQGSGVRLADLGIYRLRNAEDPERLFQVEYPDMPRREFPPLMAEAGYGSHLPLTFTRFFGREDEMALLRELLLSEAIRLVTLTGPPGSGKTRLALEVARQLSEQLRGAVWFVSLADNSDPG